MVHNIVIYEVQTNLLRIYRTCPTPHLVFIVTKLSGII